MENGLERFLRERLLGEEVPGAKPPKQRDEVPGAKPSKQRDEVPGAKPLAVLGAGSVLKADDAAGVRVVERLMARFPQAQYPNLLLCVGETAPENYTGKIVRFKPDHLLLIDAADVGKEPGQIVEIQPQDVGGPTFCSHMLPLRVMVDYIQREIDTKVTLLGMQYKTIDFDGAMSPEMEGAVEALVQALSRVIGEM